MIGVELRIRMIGALGMAIRVRMATGNDIEKLIEARFDFFEAEKFDVPPETRPTIEASLHQYFSQHLNTGFFAALAEDNNRIVSLAFLAILEKPASPLFPTGRTGTILNVLTYPEYRRKGLATQTMGLLIEEGKEQNLSYIELSASESGQLLYKKLGFENKEPHRYPEMRLSLL